MVVKGELLEPEFTAIPAKPRESLIEKMYNEGSQGKWYFKCPNCNQFYLPVTPETSHICFNCEFVMTLAEHKWAKNNGEWRHHNPHAKNRSYHMPANPVPATFDISTPLYE